MPGRAHAGETGCANAGQRTSGGGAPRSPEGHGVARIVTPRCTPSSSSEASSGEGLASPTVSGGTSACWRRSAAQRKRRGDTGSAVAVGRVRSAGSSATSGWRRTCCPHPRAFTPSAVARPGSTSEAPAGCRDAGDRGTVCVHGARTGLWGGRLGNRWLYPEADRFQRRLTPSVRLPFRLGSCQSCWDGILYQHEAADCP
jgi:hypothetical protein